MTLTRRKSCFRDGGDRSRRAAQSAVIEESISVKAAFFRLQGRLNRAVPVGRGLAVAVSPIGQHLRDTPLRNRRFITELLL